MTNHSFWNMKGTVTEKTFSKKQRRKTSGKREEGRISAAHVENLSQKSRRIEEEKNFFLPSFSIVGKVRHGANVFLMRFKLLWRWESGAEIYDGKSRKEKV
jgi:hypothetical protein